MADAFVGEIRIFAGPYAPDGWAFCDGSSLPVNGNDALYSLIGTTFGGSAGVSFNVPDLRGRLVVGTGAATSTTSAYPMGSQGGAETVTLTAAQIPSHSHSINALTTTASSPTAGPTAMFASLPSNLTLYIDTTQPLTSAVLSFADAAIGSMGGGAAHANMMPATAINYIISLTGYYPSRS